MQRHESDPTYYPPEDLEVLLVEALLFRGEDLEVQSHVKFWREHMHDLVIAASAVRALFQVRGWVPTNEDANND